MRTTVNLNSTIFDSVALQQATASFITRQMKDFKNLTKRRMIESKPSGRLYRRGRGDGFTRSHKASARGQRPAIDRGKLLNSIKDQRTDAYSGTVSADTSYAKYLQDPTKLDRQIFRESDVREAQEKAVRDGYAMVNTLV